MKFILRRTSIVILFFTLTLLLGTFTSTVVTTKERISQLTTLPNQWNPLSGPAGTGMNSLVRSLIIDNSGLPRGETEPVTEINIIR